MNINAKKELDTFLDVKKNHNLREKIRLIVFDFDGVFTDGKIIFDHEGKPTKHYNAKDGMGIFQLHKFNVNVGVISGWRENPSQKAILEHLKIKHVSLGSNEKLAILKNWCQELNINLNQVAYMGDDINDVDVMKQVGFVACPCDAVQEVQQIANFVCTKEGGNGAVREFCDYILKDDYNVCFCVPARINSTRLPGKLLLPIQGKSCIQHTISNIQNSKYFNDNIIVLTDDEKIKNELNNYPCKVILTTEEYKNGTERISKNLDKINEKYNIIINVQADEPFISSKNIDFCIEKHYENFKSDIFYTTLHEESNTREYLESTASLKMLTDNSNNVLYYSRNLIPYNKKGDINKDYVYKTFTGIYVFNRKMLELFPILQNGELQLEEDCEQLKILESGYKIKSFPTVEYNEISLNTMEDYNYLKKKYNTSKSSKISSSRTPEIFCLDCTLRDGGYNNNWRFDKDFLGEYIELVSKMKMDYVEIGFINKQKQEKGQIIGKARNIDKEYISLFENKNFKICAMGDYGNIDLDFLKKGSKIDMVRIAFHKKNYKEAIEECESIVEMGYTVSANVMGITNYSTEEMMDLIDLVNKSKIDIVCVADSFGSLQESKLESILYIFQENLDSCMIGVHLHNNMNNAYANYQHIKNICKKSCVVDSTFFGMGRGAGNLQTELVFFDKVDNEQFCELLIFIEKYIKMFMTSKSTSWGYDLDYLFTGLLGIHPNYVVKMREKNVSFHNMLFLLKHIFKMKKHAYFDLGFLEDLLKEHEEILI